MLCDLKGKGHVVALMPRWEVPTAWRIGWNVGVAAYTAFVGVMIALDRNLKPTTAKWVHNAKFQIAIVSVLVVVTMLDAIRRAVVRKQSIAEEKRSVEIRNQLASALVAVADSLNLSVSQLGAGLFLVKPRGVRRPERLVRLERVRIPDDLHESGVKFVKGKGAVGSCWAHERPVHQPLIAINQKYADEPELISHRWGSLSEQTTKNFTQAEFIAVVGKYAEVLAVPIMDNGKFVGCIALDRRWDRSATDDRSLLNTDATKKVLGAAAKTVLPTLTR